MKDFTASNGLVVHHTSALELALGNYMYFSDAEEQALREFFRAEEDERLGRWRWPKNPDYVVYIDPSGDQQGMFGDDIDIVVMRETDGWCKGYVRAEDKGGTPAPHRTLHILAARAYFESRTEPRPWHDAKTDEAWELTANGDTGPFVTKLTPSGAVHFVAGNGTTFVAESSDITSGRRIYPEPLS